MFYKDYHWRLDVKLYVMADGGINVWSQTLGNRRHCARNLMVEICCPEQEVALKFDTIFS